MAFGPLDIYCHFFFQISVWEKAMGLYSLGDNNEDYRPGGVFRILRGDPQSQFWERPNNWHFLLASICDFSSQQCCQSLKEQSSPSSYNQSPALIFSKPVPQYSQVLLGSALERTGFGENTSYACNCAHLVATFEDSHWGKAATYRPTRNEF